jgi:UV DNA damage endonuclease
MDGQRADPIATMPASYAQVPWTEIEAKLKVEAIAGLGGGRQVEVVATPSARISTD